jgi:hypothetical protein
MLRYASRIGAYSYPNRSELEVTAEKSLLTTETSQGRYSVGSRELMRRVTVKGALFAEAGPDRGLTLQQLAEELLYAHRSLDPENFPNDATHHQFYLTYDADTPANTRILDVSVKSVVLGDYKKPLTKCPFVIEMETGDEPFSYCPVEQEEDLPTDGEPGLVAVAGTAFCYPVFSLTLTREEEEPGQVQIVNQTIGLTFTLTPSVSGTYVIDADAHNPTVKRGGVDAFAESDDELVLLTGGNNSVRIIASGGVEVTAASVAWKDRYF